MLLPVADDGRPVRRDLASMAAIDENRFLLFGGRSESGKALNDLWLFDIRRCEMSRSVSLLMVPMGLTAIHRVKLMCVRGFRTFIFEFRFH